MFQDILLIDADSIYFRVAVVTQKKNEIRKGIKHTMDSIRKNCGVDDYLCAVKGSGNYRMDVDSSYKGQRKALDPKIKEAIDYGLQHMVDEYGAVKADDMEADDLVSIWAHEMGNMMGLGKEPIIVAIDKDLLQIPGWHYNFVKKEPPRYINEDEAHMLLMLQCLTGDTADNIKGIKGIGPKKAAKILSNVPMERRWSRIRAAYRAHKTTNLDTNYVLLKMLTSWSEYEEVRNKFERKTTEREHHVPTEQAQDSSVQELPDGDT